MSEAKPQPKTGPDAFGMLVYLLYIGVGGLLVFMFAWSIRGAVEVQNAAICGALSPEFRSQVTATVTRGGVPISGAVFNPGPAGKGMATTDDEGKATLLLPHGPQELVVASEGSEPVVFGLDLPGSEALSIAFDLDSQATTIESREPFMAPAFEVQDLEGNAVSLEDFRGKLVLVNFWATWCEPCITEWPQLDQLAERIDGRDDVVILAISIDQKREDILPFLERMSLAERPKNADGTPDMSKAPVVSTKVNVLWDPTNSVNVAYGSEKIPDTFFVDEAGRLSAAFVNVRKWGNPEAFHCVDGTVGDGR
ncbi:MAG: TlpA family protein disulfide reductase [Nannocystaceae bacterium]|nr:TlpA family protein disulfide reductase [bacterium]